MSYQRQLSPLAAKVMALLVAAMFAVGALAFFPPMVLFGPVILLVLCGGVIVIAGRYAWTGNLERSDQGGLLVGWALAAPAAFLAMAIAPALASLVWPAAGSGPAAGPLPPDPARSWFAGILVLHAVAAGLFFLRDFVRTPEKTINTGEQIGKGPAAAIMFLSFQSFVLAVAFTAPATTILAAMYLRGHDPGFRACAARQEALAEIRRGRWPGHRPGCPCLDCWELRKRLVERRTPLPPEKLSGVCPVHRVYDQATRRFLDSCRANRAKSMVLRAFLLLACLPALLLGAVLLRRGLWLASLRRLIGNLPTSKAASAAMGLVELAGTARRVQGADLDPDIMRHVAPEEDGSATRVESFYLEDGTGRVLVEPPAGYVPGSDETITLSRRAEVRGLQRDIRLRDGDTVYVLGELAPAAEGREAVVRPWTPPYGRFLIRFTHAILSQSWGAAEPVSMDRVLGLSHPLQVFLVTDAGEEEARSLLFRGWQRQVAAGLAALAGAAALILAALF